MAVAGQQQGAEDGHAKGASVWREALKKPDANPIRCRGAWLIASAVIAGIANAVTPIGTLRDDQDRHAAGGGERDKQRPAAPAAEADDDGVPFADVSHETTAEKRHRPCHDRHGQQSQTDLQRARP